MTSEFEIFWVDPSELIPSVRRGSSKSPAALTAIEESMKADGYLVSEVIPCVRDAEGRLHQHGGHTRAAIAKKLGLLVAVMIVPPEIALQIEIQQDKAVYGMYAGKAIEWIACDWPALEAEHSDWCDSKIAANIGNAYGLGFEDVESLRAAADAIASGILTPDIANLKNPADAADFFERLQELNQTLSDLGLPPVTCEKQATWLKAATASVSPRDSYQHNFTHYNGLPRNSRKRRERTVYDAVAAFNKAVEALLKFPPLDTTTAKDVEGMYDKIAQRQEALTDVNS